jgi:hypothetical protein
MSELKERIVEVLREEWPVISQEVVDRLSEKVVRVIEPPKPAHSPLPWGTNDDTGLAGISDAAGAQVGHAYKGNGQPGYANRDLILAAVNSVPMVTELAMWIRRNLEDAEEFRVQSGSLMHDRAKAILRSYGK